MEKKYTRWIVTLSSFFAVLLLMDSCLQFRMSKKEVSKQSTFLEGGFGRG
jgi:hypothetical protein